MAARPLRGPRRPGRARGARLETPDRAGPGSPALSTDVDAAVRDAYQGEWSRIVASLIRATGDWDLAEDAAAGAFERAVATWPRDGVPTKPGAWLTTTARHLALDRLRRRGVEAAKLKDWTIMDDARGRGEDDPAELATGDPEWDDRLRLIFTCAHPALPLEARVALTLRAVGGLTTAEIARAFLVGEATMAQRIVRAKAKITRAGIPYRVPGPDLLAERLDGVLAVLYLIHNEGYLASSGEDLQRPDLTVEAIRLTRLLAGLLPDPEVIGLLALLLLQHSRTATRVDAAGDLVPLEEQDRTRWDGGEIREAIGLLAAATGERGPYRVQAEIQAVHAAAATPADTRWPTILALYDELPPTPVVSLNRAVALGMAEGPDAGLAALRDLETDPALAGHHLLPAARADLSRRAGRMEAAAGYYRAALRLAPTGAEQRYLRRRLAELDGAQRTSV
ncbi:MAG: sigma factor-like helix-turn-helix DNA-binding protein [Propionicimonas sp.]|uniref:RNA polymerase sigma factor n=1 Tax=Propionicimonas sp. TaxID=1955623 RepID=UPI003D0E2D40